ncbi:MAG: hypothetical protein WCI71_09345, partial [Bacteroidota bacterium]
MKIITIKHIVFLLLVVLLTTAQTKAQTGINTDGSQPASSSMLDIKSTDKGFLPPRMNKTQRNAIVNPPAGLIVFCTDCGEGNTGILSLYANGVWSNFTPCICPGSPSSGSNVPLLTQITWNWSSVPLATGYKWNIVNDYLSATDIGANTSKIETGLHCNFLYTRYIWAYNTCGISAATTLSQSTLAAPPDSPVAGAHDSTYNEIVWHWNAVPGANGYKWNTTDDSLSATKLSITITSKTESGLTCNHAYTRYLWAYGNCGTSPVTTLTKSTSLNPPAAPVAGVHVPSFDQIVWNW